VIDEYSSKLLLLLAQKGSARFSDLKDAIENPRTLKRKLDMLSLLDLVEKRKKEYTITDKGRDVSRKIDDLLSTLGKSDQSGEIDRLPYAFAPILKRYRDIIIDHFGKRLAGILLFGSVARGNWGKNSDIDLLIVVDSWEKPSWERSREMQKLRAKLRGSEEYRTLISRGYIPAIQHYLLDTNEAKRTNRIYIDACIESVILYEREKFLSEVLQRVRDRLEQLGARRIYRPGKGHHWVLCNNIPIEGLEI
jgi:DNA-binding HxlR family transcriptional regulator